jgi:exosortase/archaeosortase family protein
VFAAVLMSLFFAASSTDVYRVGLGEPYLEWTAQAAAKLLRLLEVPAVVTQGNLLYASDFALSVERGCDASTECALFAALIIAFPAGFVRKLAGIGLGLAVLVAANVMRVGTLALVGIHAPALFEWLHVDVWQVVFVLLAVGLWAAAWFPWAIRNSSAVAESAG